LPADNDDVSSDRNARCFTISINDLLQSCLSIWGAFPWRNVRSGAGISALPSSCPVALYSAKHDRGSIHFNLINPKTGNRIRMITPWQALTYDQRRGGYAAPRIFGGARHLQTPNRRGRENAPAQPSLADCPWAEPQPAYN
jgi:hypothetical protein